MPSTFSGIMLCRSLLACLLSAASAVDVTLLALVPITDSGQSQWACKTEGSEWAPAANNGAGGCTTKLSERSIASGAVLAMEHCTSVVVGVWVCVSGCMRAAVV